MVNTRQKVIRVSRFSVKNGTLHREVSSSAMSMLLSRNHGGNGVGVWQFEIMKALSSHIGQVGCGEF
ncbi:hypothetical protein LINPERHAP1_LOCUS2341 [Linum perenne]